MKALLKKGFNGLDSLFSKAFTPKWNPIYQLGALSFFYFWIVVVTGVYLFIFFENLLWDILSNCELPVLSIFQNSRRNFRITEEKK